MDEEEYNELRKYTPGQLVERAHDIIIHASCDVKGPSEYADDMHKAVALLQDILTKHVYYKPHVH